MTLTHEDILNYCNYLINKDQVADPISPEEYNAVIPVVNIEVFNREKKRISDLTAAQHIKFAELLRESYLNALKKSNTVQGPQVAQLADDFDMLISAKAVFTDSARKVNVVSEDKFDELSSGLVDNTDSVYAYLSGKKLYLSEHAVTLHYSYLSVPVKPVFDYYIDGSGKWKYLKIGYYVAEQHGEYDVFDENANLIARSVLYPQENHQSLSVEFAFGDTAYPEVVNLIFEKMGVEIREQMPVEFSQIKKAEV